MASVGKKMWQLPDTDYGEIFLAVVLIESLKKSPEDIEYLLGTQDMTLSPTIIDRLLQKHIAKSTSLIPEP